MPECGVAVEGNIVAYPCHLDGGHEGPHEAIENAASVRERKRWVEAQKQLSDFHGPPQTTAERYTVNPQPYPDDSDKADALKAETEMHEPVLEERVTEQDLEVQRNMHRTTSEDLADTTPTKTRPGDQPLPVQREGEDSVQARMVDKARKLVEVGLLDEQEFQIISESMENSIKVGVERYGTALQTFNGRDTLQDVVDEARDLFVYLSALNQAREQDRSVAIEAAVTAVYNWHSSQGAGASPTVEEIVKVAVDTVYDGLGL